MLSAETPDVPTMLLGVRRVARCPFPAQAWKPQMLRLSTRAKSPSVSTAKAEGAEQGQEPLTGVEDLGNGLGRRLKTTAYLGHPLPCLYQREAICGQREGLVRDACPVPAVPHAL